MSTRLKPGDIVTFAAERRVGDMQDAHFGRVDELGDATECMHDCGDPDCREWPNVELLDGNGRRTGDYAMHICECEMQPLDAQAAAGMGQRWVSRERQIEVTLRAVRRALRVPGPVANRAELLRAIAAALPPEQPTDWHEVMTLRIRVHPGTGMVAVLSEYPEALSVTNHSLAEALAEVPGALGALQDAGAAMPDLKGMTVP